MYYVPEEEISKSLPPDYKRKVNYFSLLPLSRFSATVTVFNFIFIIWKVICFPKYDVSTSHDTQCSTGKGKGKAIPLQAWTGREDSRRLSLPDFKTDHT
jgi:hypothetical protein